MPASGQRNARTLARLRGLPKRVAGELRPVFGKIGADQLADVRNSFSGRPGLVSRSGTLAGTFKSRTVGRTSIDSVRQEIYSQGSGKNTLTGQGYGRLQEFGGTIVPRRKAALTIPLSSNVGPDGLPKYKSAAALRAQGRTKLIVTRSGKWLILVKEGNEFLPMWVLKSSVYIPPRLKFYASFEARKAERPAKFGSAIVRAINGGK